MVTGPLGSASEEDLDAVLHGSIDILFDLAQLLPVDQGTNNRIRFLRIADLEG